MRRFLVAIAVLVGTGIALVPLHGAGAATGHAVTIADTCGGPAFCFTPSTITITDGDTVTWRNTTGTDHLVGPCEPATCDGVSGGTGTDASFTTGFLAGGATFSHTFHGTGTYTYFCAIHGYAGMHGTIVVNAAAPSTTATPPPTPGTTPATRPAASTPGSTPVAGVAPTPTTADPARRDPRVGPELASTGSSTGSTLAVGIGLLVLGLAAWGGCTPRRGKGLCAGH